MLGIGLQKLGVSPAGIGEPEPAPKQPAPGTGAPDLTTGNYRISSHTGDVARTTRAQHLVWMALATRLKSATIDSKLGIKWPVKITEGYEFEFRAAIETALYDVTRNQLVRLDDVTFERDGKNNGRVKIWVEFTDLATNYRDKVPVYASGY